MSTHPEAPVEVSPTPFYEINASRASIDGFGRGYAEN